MFHNVLLRFTLFYSTFFFYGLLCYTMLYSVFLMLYSGIQPESWLRIQKFEAQGPSFFQMQANFHKIGLGSLKFLEHS